MGPRLILASSSPRRRELLRAAGFEFRVALSAATESTNPQLTMRELAVLNAARKAMEIARANPEAVVLGADTLVSFRGVTIGKPRDLQDAATILRRLSGQTHEVCSAVQIIHLRKGRMTAFQEVTQVTFHPLNDEAIAEYLRTINPLDKAGAYAAQEEGARIIRKVSGSFTNVVGLPMEKTTDVLHSFGISPRSNSRPGPPR